jgi:catechol 2,3-dioxygenase-like lactoylglutathione lyase family enzyme
MNLHHINIKGTWDLLAKERDFFCEVLGFREGHRPNFSFRGYWLYAGENALVHLSESESDISSRQQGHFDHVAFQTSGLSALVKTLENKEIEHSVSYLAEIDMSQIFCQSPSGTKIEINFPREKI